MEYPTLSENVNTSEGLHNILVYTNTVTDGLFTPLLLFSMFMIMTLGIYFSQQRLTGKNDFPVAFAGGSFFIFALSIILSMVSGIINLFTMVVVVVVNVIAIIFLLTSER